MDFSFNEEQQDLQGLAKQILENEVTNERLKETEAGETNFDRDLWAKVAEAGLLGIAIPEAHGGGGYGFLEVALVLEQVGRTVAPVPYYEATVLGALPIAQFGSDAQQAALLPAIASGESIVTAALFDGGTDPLVPTTKATRAGDGWKLNGVKDCVPAGPLADRVLVPARTDDGAVIIAIVDPAGAGVTRESQQTTDNHPEARLTLADATVADADVLVGPEGGAEALQWIVERATAALAVIAIGICEEAVRMTAEYTKTREQFDRPIATFQAVGQRAADAYIDTEGIRLTSWQAAWRLSEGLEASTEVAVAKFWAADGGQRVVHAAQHLHGGMGVDRDYPLHRYFLWAKKLELTLGGATQQLLKIGRTLADEPVPA
ncbi:MAG TPA: acyl-CoA dehydrogenase family protein [Acidimicrobiia bacterium]|nr:acyl-CoA dehydrogenase family protein [Acidimicrobiia bacterium]